MLDSSRHECGSVGRSTLGVVGDDIWASLADQFADEAYASAKGCVRTYVMHRQLLEHLPAPSGSVLDVGGGAGHQSFSLAEAGYDVTLLRPAGVQWSRVGPRRFGAGSGDCRSRAGTQPTRPAPPAQSRPSPRGTEACVGAGAGLGWPAWRFEQARSRSTTWSTAPADRCWCCKWRRR